MAFTEEDKKYLEGLKQDIENRIPPLSAIPIYGGDCGCGTSPEEIYTYDIISKIVQACGWKYAQTVANAVVPAAVTKELEAQIAETKNLLKTMLETGTENIDSMEKILKQTESILAAVRKIETDLEQAKQSVDSSLSEIEAMTEGNTVIKQAVESMLNQIKTIKTVIEEIKIGITETYNTFNDVYTNRFLPKYNETYQWHEDVKHWHKQIFGKLEGNLAEAERLIRELEGLNPDVERVLGELRPLVEAGLTLEEEIKNARQSVENKGLEEISKLDAKGAETLTALDVAKTDALQAIDVEKTDIETIIGEARTALEAKEQEALQGIGTKERDALQNIAGTEKEITDAGAEAVQTLTQKEITAKEAIELLAESERQSLLNLLTASTLKAQNPGGLLPPAAQPFVLGYGSFEIEDGAYKLLPSKDDTVEGTVEFTNDGGALTLQTQTLTEPKTWQAGQIIKLAVPINLVINSADIENIEVTAALAVKNGSETRFFLTKNFTLTSGNEVRIFPFDISSETSLEAGNIIAFGLSFPQITVIGRSGAYLARIPLGSKIRPTELIEMKTLPVTETDTQNILNTLAAGLAKTDVEVGSNGNGSYVKFNNGLLICLGKAVDSTNSGSGILYTHHVFPHAFRDMQYLCCPANFKRIAAPQNQYFYWSGLENATPSGISFGYIGNGNNIRYMAGIIAAGFWK